MARQDADVKGRKGNGTGKRGPKRDGAGKAYQITNDVVLELVTLSLAVMRKQGAVRWGLTRDGGALAIGVYFGDDYGTEYVRPAESVADACQEIFVAWTQGEAAEYAQIRALVVAGQLPI